MWLYLYESEYSLDWYIKTIFEEVIKNKGVQIQIDLNKNHNIIKKNQNWKK